MLFATGGCKSMAHEPRKTGVLDFVTHAAHERAAHYREHASQLRKMAAKENAGRLRNNLQSLADQYEDLADGAAVKPTG
jgi:hypothetical protein